MGKFTTVDNFLEKNSDISYVENIINSKNVENRESFSNFVNIITFFYTVIPQVINKMWITLMYTE